MDLEGRRSWFVCRYYHDMLGGTKEIRKKPQSVASKPSEVRNWYFMNTSKPVKQL
jgi:hypothetical protein